jgi:uroporphyrin-III C-methyltransferase
MKWTASKVYLVGAGPGAPDLITLRGAEVLKRADIVFHDALVHAGVIALAVRAEKILVGKRCGRYVTAQQFINKRLVDAARKHRVVVRLKGGDPMMFGRVQEEIAALEAAGVPYEIVPGVTAASAAAAEAGVSLTQRGVARSVSFVTPRVGKDAAPSGWAEAAVAADTTVIYMGAGEAEAITTALLAAGAPEALPVLVVENATLSKTRRISLTLAELPRIAQLGLTGPVLIMLGAVFTEASATSTETSVMPSCKTA